MATMKNIQLLAVHFADPTTASTAVSSIFRTNISPKHLEDDDFYTFGWSIETKYFTANISVCCCPDYFFDNIVVDGCASVLSSQLAGVEAVLLIADLNDDKCINKLKRIMSTIAEKEVEICLLYCTNEVTSTNTRDLLNTFCIQNHFEMIENEEEDPNADEEDEEDAFQEKYGVDRVVEALKSHVWSGHVMKDPSARSNIGAGIGADEAVGLNAEEGASGSRSEGVTDASTLNDFSELNELAGDLCDTDLSFQELFGKFLTMKETARALDGEERREYAAKVSMAFMDALGIDEGESSEEEDTGGEGDGIR